MSLLLPPLALYIHIPWCIRKCPYCDFNSHQADQTLPEEAYVKALALDLQQDQILAQGRKLTSIFLGGGTPSLLSANAVANILSDAEKQIGFESDIEITLEANPGTFEQEKFSGFRAAGVNRLSIGVQSFQNRQLQLLGRVHDGNEALRAVDVARKAGFDNINLDLMHGLPEQNAEGAIADLNQAIQLSPEHISWYQLTIEQNTAFYSAPPILPDEDILIDIQDAGESLLAGKGYAQYEISAYCRDKKQARHNLNYWQFGDYLGIGAGAHAKITLPDNSAIIRFWKTRLPQHYLQAADQDLISTKSIYHQNRLMGGAESLVTSALPLEFMMNALRLTQGVAVDLFSGRTGLAFSRIEKIWQGLADKGLVEIREGQLRPTLVGRRYLNQLLQAFIES